LRRPFKNPSTKSKEKTRGELSQAKALFYRTSEREKS
jgi:hypothetical protein